MKRFTIHFLRNSLWWEETTNNIDLKLAFGITFSRSPYVYQIKLELFTHKLLIIYYRRMK